ncbi:MAG: glycosyltransferase family 39 protein, partial [Candidatus Melainabacteria bacterium]|nr:glycosyltransferase family 39 protein [Candidatus Melainabacteria bacterium]
MGFVKRLPLYILTLLPSLGLLLFKIVSRRFNVDEFQHTHLAWMTLHADKLQYRDIWDNHGPIYTWINIALIKIANLGADVNTLMAERYLNLVILILGFFVLFELFHRLTGKWYLAVLGPWFFAASNFSMYAIQTRPDNLQCLFLYSALLVLVIALQKKQSDYSFGAGILLALMLLTNLKSLSALFAILIALVLIGRLGKEIKILAYLKSLVIGLALVFAIAAGMMAAAGMLEGYIYDNLLFNFAYVDHFNTDALKKVFQHYFKEHQLFFVVSIPALIFWLCRSIKSENNRFDPASFLLAMVTLILLLTRLKANIWPQYDLLYIPLLCFLASNLVLEAFDKQFRLSIKSRFWGFVILLPALVFFIFAGWFRYYRGVNTLDGYKKNITRKLLRTKNLLKEGEHIENFSLFAPELAFFETGSRWLLLHHTIMETAEKVYQREIFADEYIKLLN